jgi:hypothetical protein
MSIISCHSDTDLSKDRAVLINSYRVPLLVPKGTKIGLTSLSFSKERQFSIVENENDTFYVRLYDQGVDEFGKQFKVLMVPGFYTGDELATHITTLLGAHPLSNYEWVCFFDSDRVKFDINMVQNHTPTTTLTCQALIQPGSGQIEFVNNTSAKVSFKPDSTWLTSTSFANALPDMMCSTVSQIQPDGTNINGVNTEKSGGLWTVQIVPQQDNTPVNIGYGGTNLGITSYWQMNNTNTNTRPVLDGTKSMINLSIKDTMVGGGGSDVQIDLSIMKPSSTINPGPGAWEGTQQVVIASASPLTSLNSITVDGTALVNWTSFTYKTDHVYASIELEMCAKVRVHLWHDTAGDGIAVEERVIAITGQNGFDFMIKQVHHPIIGTCAMCSGNVDTPNLSYLSGNFSLKTKTNGLSPLASQIATPLDSTEVLSGIQGELTPSSFYKFGSMNSTEGNPGDWIPEGANSDSTLGMKKFESNGLSSVSSVISNEKAITVLVSPDIHVELSEFNIKALRSKRQDIARTIAIIPSEELGNTDTGIIHYSTSQPIMISMNLTEDTSISNMVVSLKDANGRLLTDLIGNTNLALLASM